MRDKRDFRWKRRRKVEFRLTRPRVDIVGAGAVAKAPTTHRGRCTFLGGVVFIVKAHSAFREERRRAGNSKARA